ncbi:MAG: hypothetical protein O3B41_01600 [Bacteroidetes bacterium]|nr:hypothetical protein [Bacteroidota bacterium]
MPYKIALKTKDLAPTLKIVNRVGYLIYAKIDLVALPESSHNKKVDLCLKTSVKWHQINKNPPMRENMSLTSKSITPFEAHRLGLLPVSGRSVAPAISTSSLLIDVLVTLPALGVVVLVITIILSILTS